MNEPVPAPAGEGPAGLLISRDLIFISKITGTARMLGFQVLTAGNAALAQAMIAQWHPLAVFIDLAAGDLVKADAILAYRANAGVETAFVAFGSHVDTSGLAAASDAGCDLVLPRSKFSAELPEIITRFLDRKT